MKTNDLKESKSTIIHLEAGTMRESLSLLRSSREAEKALTYHRWHKRHRSSCCHTCTCLSVSPSDRASSRTKCMCLHRGSVDKAENENVHQKIKLQDCKEKCAIVFANNKADSSL